MTQGWIKFLDSRMLNLVFSAAIAIFTVILGQGMIAKRELSKSVSEQIQSKASLEQVDEKVSGLKSYVDTMDDSMESMLQQHIEQSNQSNQIMMEYIKSIDANVKDIKRQTNNK